MMAEKKQEQAAHPEGAPPSQAPTMPAPKPAEKLPDTSIPVPTASSSSSGLRGLCNFHKTHPNELYRKLLPAVLFLMTFVTVMTMLLVYMDTVALGAQQFRLNMSRDYELSNIRQDEPSLVAYVRQLHTLPRHSANHIQAQHTDRIRDIDQVFGEKHTGTFVEILTSGARDPTSAFLESQRKWHGLVLRAAPTAFLTLQGHVNTLHACLSTTEHPREVSYHDADSISSGFSSRVLCLPLFTVLLSARLTSADWVLLAGHNVLPALKHTPMQNTTLKLIEVRAPNATVQEQTTAYLQTQNYTVKAIYPDGVMYILNDKDNK